ncbi:MAG: double-strand break repair helicase AddA [Acetobacteraceae bacterium]
MSQLARDRANAAQRLGSDPAMSAFVGASAGSGKTKLLTDRLLRLMLGGAAPERIQCLTFTKAAAAEMALRLHRTLGEWVTLDDAALNVRLLALSVVPTEEARKRARALFATVLDLPGGMRIETIHAFCQSLLRRFPLEAALSPHFTVADEREASDALTEAREDMLASAHVPTMRDALRQLAGLTSAAGFHKLVAGLLASRERLAGCRALGPALADAQRRALQVMHASAEHVLDAAVAWPEEATLRAAAERVAADGSPACRAKAARILTWLGTDATGRRASWDGWREEFLTGKGEPRKGSGFVNDRLTASSPTLREAMLAEVDRVSSVEDARRGCDMAALSHALVTLAAPVLEGYARRKDAAGLLDYDDLIGRSSGLLVDPGAAWVLYKLDGGLDHLLLDEVQDTAPAQWRIAHALTTEFFVGQGAVEAPRTVFAVGDRKQSIFSFQGADATEFDRARATLGERVRGAAGRWIEPSLNVSFRSVTPVLELVDTVFANPLAAAGVCEPGEMHHESDRAGQAGAVELWPLAPRPEVPETPGWTVPERNQGLKSAPQVLAEDLAAWIESETDGHVRLESRERSLRPGDVMVLVRRRNDFARFLVRELKARGVPVAGLDRMALTEQPAVQDLLALADALLLPQDDLQFACFLTSPLGDLTDDSLMALAMDRRGTLWEALRARAAERADWAQAWDMFAALLARVDYAAPHALLAEALGRLGGRARLFARLGAEAGEPVDELLNAALTYTRLHPPSLQGFLHWLRRSGAEVKREQEAAGRTVRVMTVHGAKGLQAPLVILPDTTALPPPESGILWARDPQSGTEVPLWAPRKEMQCAEAGRLADVVAAERMEEHNRLLYVALTRAEDRLVICGWEPKGKLPEQSWYALARVGFAALGAEGTESPGWEHEPVRHAVAQTATPDRTERGAAPGATRPLPGWAGVAPLWRPAAPPAEPALARPLAPSRPGGAELGGVPPAASPLAARDAGSAKRRGRLVHALLQHLPALPPERRHAAALMWLDRPGNGLAPGEAKRIAGQVLALLEHPDLAPLFGPDSRAEVPLSGVVAGQVVGGLVDRLAVLDDRVLVADYKTNRRPPAQAGATPVMYLRQMAAYRAVLAAIFPDRPIECVLVWTEDTRPIWLPGALLDAHGLIPSSATPIFEATNP